MIMNVDGVIEVTFIENGINNEKIKMIIETRNENSRAFILNKTFFWIIAAAAESSAEQDANVNQNTLLFPLRIHYKATVRERK